MDPNDDAAPAVPAFPAAEGSRMPWSGLPGHVLDAVEERLGAPVVEALDRPGGFSPGVAARLLLADGRRAFVKAVGSSRNPDSPDLHRDEAGVTAAMPSGAPVPRLLFDWDDGEWVALAFEDIDGHAPHVPWLADELERVLGAVGSMHATLTPSPVAAPATAERFGPQFRNWRSLASGEHPAPDGLDPWARRNLDRLAELESAWAEASAGDTLLHGDLRADNILLTPERVVFVDWPSASVGAAWVDLVFMLPSVAMQRGPEPDGRFEAHPSAGEAPAGAVDAVLAALAGYFHVRGLLPPPPGLPTLRAFQSAQGVHAMAWLRRRTGWS